jgi:hypothetical protein
MEGVKLVQAAQVLTNFKLPTGHLVQVPVALTYQLRK